MGRGAPGRPGGAPAGKGIQPGLYRNASVGDGCYWARLSGLGGGLEDIVANDNASGSAIVEIGAGDVAFESTRCGGWTKVE